MATKTKKKHRKTPRKTEAYEPIPINGTGFSRGDVEALARIGLLEPWQVDVVRWQVSSIIRNIAPFSASNELKHLRRVKSLEVFNDANEQVGVPSSFLNLFDWAANRAEPGLYFVRTASGGYSKRTIEFKLEVSDDGEWFLSFSKVIGAF